ncbi:ABC transporter ATP-binding protein [Paenibacillus sp. GYB003]|uniref:ABC transporter ATP-binding protein n=1 Tax=Paenibacillus sp. GYB003 TaxID=2994392 RepID=UPI002F969D26
MKKSHNRLEPLAWMLKFIWLNARFPFLVASLQQILSACLPVTVAFAVGRLIKEIEGNGSYVWQWVLLLVLAHLAGQGFVFNSFKDYLYQQKLEAALDDPILQKVSKLPLTYFEQSEFFDLITRMAAPSKRIASIAEDILHTLGTWMKMVLLLLYIGGFFWWLIPVLMVISIISSRFDTKIGVSRQTFEKKMTVTEREKTYAEQLLSGRTSTVEVKVFGLKKELIGRWNSWSARIHKARLAFELVILKKDLLVASPRIVILLTCIVLIGWQMREGNSGLAIFSSTIIALLSFFDAMENTSFYSRNLGEGSAYVAEMRSLLQFPEHDKDHAKYSFPNPLCRGIEFQNVTFTYPNDDQPALKNICLQIRVGEKVALVGANGSGKSTLVKLLLGLYEPNEGKILIDGIDMKEINESDLRKSISVVFQDFVKYSLTARENIAIGQIDSIQDIDRIRNASSLGGASEFISQLPFQYETPLGKLTPYSHEPSGGQWQRIAISRGLIRQAQLFVFDEPAASLDPLAEADLYNQIGHILQDQTAVLISHRLGSVRVCDRIVVLHEGAVIEEGTHAALLQKRGLYWEMHSAQSGWYTAVKS